MSDERPITPIHWSLKPKEGSFDILGLPATPAPEPPHWYVQVDHTSGHSRRDGYYGESKESCGRCDTDACGCSYNESGAYNDDVLRQWGIYSTSVSLMARTFYGAMALGMKYPDKVALKDSIVHDVAEQVYRGLVLACVGESRYDIRPAIAGLWAARVKKRGSKVVNSAIYRHPMIKIYELWPGGAPSYREQIADPVIRTVDIFDVRNIRFIRNVFLWAGRFSHGTSASYGGLMWAACAQLALDWRAGRLTDVEFVDRVFDARHNGAPVLTKVFKSYTSTDTLFLTARSEASLEWLIRWTPNAVRERFGLSRVVPLRGDMYSIKYSEDGEMLSVIPDDKDSVWAADEWKRVRRLYRGLDDFQSDSRALTKSMVKKIRAKERFFLYGAKCTCDHGCKGKLNHPLNTEHDCLNVCNMGCDCQQTLSLTKFQELSLGNDGDTCSNCGSDEHDTEECSYCDNCDSWGHITYDCDEESYDEDDDEFVCDVCGHKSDCDSCADAHYVDVHETSTTTTISVSKEG